MLRQNTDLNIAAKESQRQADKVVFFTCGGASNCGQIASQVAIKLDKEGLGSFRCIAGIGAHNEEMIESAKSAMRLVVLDGCETACAKSTIEHAGLGVTDWVCITEAGIEKVHKFAISPKQISLVLQRTKELLRG